MKKILLLVIVLSFNSYAQFDSLIFTKSMRLNYYGNSVYQLGDQNQDGFDDIMLYDCNEKRGYIYFGGKPMDTNAVNSIQFFDSAYVGGSIAVIDLNNDGVKDIVGTTVLYNDSLFYHLGPIRIYYGGSIIDTIPNITFNPPPGANGAVPQVLNDFNGDGKSELVLYDANLPFSQKQYGTLYFYNTESQFDTIPHYIITGDSVNFIAYGGISSSGDINGDGKTDFTIYVSVGEYPSFTYHRNFYMGNESWDLTPDQTFYQDEQTFVIGRMQIIEDINGDNKDDILMKAYGNVYPHYYHNSILYGSFPIDTLQDVGLNTQNEAIDLNINLTRAGDVNGDGYNDIFVRMIGTLYPNVKLWVGGRNMPYTSDDQANRTWFGNSVGFGRVISGVGDVDGDGVNDIAIEQILYGEQPDPNSTCNYGWVYIFKGDTNVIGDTGTGGINDKDIIPAEFYLYEPFPNPFNPSTVISWQSSVLSQATIKIFDMLGKEIVTLMDEEKPAGKYKLEFDAGKYNLSSGNYLINLKLKKGGKEIFTSSKKITMIK